MQTTTLSVLLLCITARATLTSDHHLGDPKSRRQTGGNMKEGMHFLRYMTVTTASF